MKRARLSAVLTIVLGCGAAVVAQTNPTGGAPGTTQGSSTTQVGGDREGQVRVVGCVQSGSAAGAPGVMTSPAPGEAGSYILTNARMASAGTAGASGVGGRAGGATSAPGAGSAASGGAAAGGSRTGDTGGVATGGAATGAQRGNTVGGTRTGGAGSGSTYMLTGSNELSKHLGHQVEITGTVASAGGVGGATGSAGATTAPGANRPTGGQTAGGNSAGDTSTANRPGSGATGDRAAADTARAGVGTTGNTQQTLRVSAVQMLSATCDR